MGQTQGRELPFDFGDKFSNLSEKTIWSVHSGRRRTDKELKVTVFVFDFTGKSPDEIKLAQSAHLRLKTLRHPNVLKYIDGIELPTCIYVVTEEAVPLEEHLSTKDGSSAFSIGWGLHQIIKAISFLNVDCGLVHRNVCLSSVFVDGAGEWKLAGVEFMHPHGDTAPPPKSLQLLKKYDPPEVGKPSATRRTEKWSTDIWGLGCLVWEVYNGTLPQVSALRNTNKIPKSLVAHYCEMVSANPKSRPNPSDLLTMLREHGAFLATHHISIALRIEELQIMEPTQRNEFFTELNKHLDSFPQQFAKHKILPQLLTAFEFGGAGSAVLAPLFKLGSLLDGEEYQRRIVPCVVKLFSSTDRATRLNLLQQLEHFIDHLQPATVNTQIFPHIANGFSDTVPVMREQTIKSMVLVAPKLSESTLNTQLLKHLAKCQLDEQAGIRTNTNVCLGKIACYLSPATRQKVLVTAFLRAFKDPFPPARCAAIGAMAATHGYYTTTDIATRILPALCTITVDKERSVRDAAFQTIKMFLGKLENISEDPEAAAQQEKTEAIASAATSWTGWAVSSLTSKLYKSTPATATAPPGGRPPQTAAGGSSRKEEREEQRTTDRGAKGAPLKEGGGVSRPTEVEATTAAASEWDTEEWEEFSMPSSTDHQGLTTSAGRGPEGEGEGEGSDMEGWEDDGWGAFDNSLGDNKPQENKTMKTEPNLSSGADFFDTFQTTPSSGRAGVGESKSEDFFSNFGPTAPFSRKEERTPPPPVSPSYFGVKGAESRGGESEGWGDWGEDFNIPVKHVQVEEKKTVPSQSSSGGMKLGAKTKEQGSQLPVASKVESSASEGWGFGVDSGWGSFDDTPTTGPATQHQGGGGESKQELLQKKREERRLKQQAAREKRAAARDLKPSGLGAVKTD